MCKVDAELKGVYDSYDGYERRLTAHCFARTLPCAMWTQSWRVLITHAIPERHDQIEAQRNSNGMLPKAGTEYAIRPQDTFRKAAPIHGATLMIRMITNYIVYVRRGANVFLRT